MATNERIRQTIRSQEAPYPPQGVEWIHEVNGEEIKEVWKNGAWAPVKSSGEGGGGAPIEILCTFDPGKNRVDPTAEGEAIIKEKGFDIIGAVLKFDTSPVPPATGPNSYDVAQVIAVNKEEGDNPYYGVYYFNRATGEIGTFTVDL